jgi:HSP20 family protein
MAIMSRRPRTGLAPLSSDMDPFRSLSDWQNQFNRFASALAPFDQEELGSAYIPDIDISEDEKGIHVKADLPGIDPKNVDVNIEGNILTLRGERKDEREEKQENYRRVERTFGSFSRAFRLPETADTEKVGAHFKNGVLSIDVPIKPDAQRQAKRIEIQAEG